MAVLAIRNPLRILLLALLCLAPVAGSYLLLDAMGQEKARLGLNERALQQAERQARALRHGLEYAAQTALVVARLPSVVRNGADCDADLAAIIRPPSMFRLIMIGETGGDIVCASSPALKRPTDSWPGWINRTLRQADAMPNGFVTDPAVNGMFLAMHLRVGTLDRAQKDRFIVIGIDPSWLAEQFDGTILPSLTMPGGASLLVIGMDGLPILKVTPDGRVLASTAPDWLARVTAAAVSGIHRIPGPEGSTMTVASVVPGDYGRSIGIIIPVDPTASPASLPRLSSPGLIQACALALSLVLLILTMWNAAASPATSATARPVMQPIPPAPPPPAPATASAPQRGSAADGVQARLIARILHKLNNALATAQGNFDLLARLHGRPNGPDADDGPRIARFLGRAGTGVSDAASLSRSLQAITRPPDHTTRPTDMNELIHRGLVLLQGTDVTTDLASGLWPAMVAPMQAEAALLRLCLDARDLVTPGAPLIIDSSNVDGAGQGQVTISLTFFSDGGVPPVEWDPPTALAAQFGPDATATVHERDGMMRIIVTLPAMAPPDQVAGGRTEGGRRAVVLLVDDDQAVRQVTAEMLAALSCDVLEAEHGEAALRLCAGMRHWPDLALLDYHMPGMKGLELAGRLRALGMATPMVLVTGYAEHAEDALRDGRLDGILHKPFAIEQLRRLVVTILPAGPHDGGRAGVAGAQPIMQLGTTHRSAE